MADLVLFDSWGGRYSDNPKAIAEAMRRRELPLRHCWVLEEGRPGPKQAEVVRPGTDEHRRAQAEARLVVFNNQLAFPDVKGPGATFVQTWHGTPYKRIGFDGPGDAGYRAHLQRSVPHWDLVLSPGPASTPRLRSAFGWDGPVLETGYPRNDALFRTPARDALGLPESARVVLYAPTFRRWGAFDLELDLEAVVEALGPDGHLLVRLHSFAPTAEGLPSHPRIHDVTDDPQDMADVLPRADALITDYSSALFDFAATGRPIVLFTPDRQAYADERGFYFDLAPVAPGPIVTTTESVIDALARAEPPPGSFPETFCSLEDGGAADRVVDALLGSRRGGEAHGRAQTAVLPRGEGEGPVVGLGGAPDDGEAEAVPAVV